MERENTVKYVYVNMTFKKIYTITQTLEHRTVENVPVKQSKLIAQYKKCFGNTEFCAKKPYLC